MNTLSYRTISANQDIVKKDWYVIDAENQVLGRLCSHVAKILRGKNKTYFTPHYDCGDNIIIINAEKVRMTGKKFDRYEYISHTGFPGGQKIRTPRQMVAHKPTSLIEHGVKGMLPKNILGREMFRHLYVYAGPEHPHQAQTPKELKINTIR